MVDLDKLQKEYLEKISECNNEYNELNIQIEELEDKLYELKDKRDSFNITSRQCGDKGIAIEQLKTFIKICELKNHDYKIGYDDLISMFSDDFKLPYDVTFSRVWDDNFTVYKENIQMKYDFS